jgi:hypothetical protein
MTIREIFEREIEKAEEELETSSFIRWLEQLRDEVLEADSDPNDMPFVR